MATFKYGEVFIMKLLSQNPPKKIKPGAKRPGFKTQVDVCLIIYNVGLNICA